MRSILFLGLLCCSICVSAQQIPTSHTKSDKSNAAIPDAPSAHAPLTAGGKLKIAARDAVHPLRIAGAAVSAGIAQASDPYPEWGDRGEGYAKRFGAAVADEASGHIFKGFLFPALLRTDPCYFREGRGGPAHRIAYAVTRVFVTRTDSGHSTFNASEQRKLDQRRRQPRRPWHRRRHGVECLQGILARDQEDGPQRRGPLMLPHASP